MNNVKTVHLERLNKLIKYIDNMDEKEISLTRNSISEIVGVKEGDSLKIVFKLLNENPELYSNSFTFKKDNRINTFFKKDNEEELKKRELQIKKKKEQDKMINTIRKVIEETNNVLQETKKISNEDFLFCRDFFQTTFDKIYIFLSYVGKKDLLLDPIAPLEENFIFSIYGLYDEIDNMNKVLMLYNILI